MSKYLRIEKKIGIFDELTDDDYLFLANCTDNEFTNFLIRWFNKLGVSIKNE